MRVGDIIKKLRKEKKLTQAQLAKKIGVAPTSVSAWERNENRPLMDKLSILAELFDVSLTRFFQSEEFEVDTLLETTRLPVISDISCENETLIYGEICSYEVTPREWLNGDDEYFYIRPQDNSMSGARIYEGDLLLIHKQTKIENSEIALVLIKEKLILRRIYKNDKQLILQSENSSYPLIFEPSTKIKIIGKLKMAIIKY